MAHAIRLLRGPCLRKPNDRVHISTLTGQPHCIETRGRIQARSFGQAARQELVPQGADPIEVRLLAISNNSSFLKRGGFNLMVLLI